MDRKCPRCKSKMKLIVQRNDRFSISSGSGCSHLPLEGSSCSPGATIDEYWLCINKECGYAEKS